MKQPLDPSQAAEKNLSAVTCGPTWSKRRTEEGFSRKITDSEKFFVMSTILPEDGKEERREGKDPHCARTLQSNDFARNTAIAIVRPHRTRPALLNPPSSSRRQPHSRYPSYPKRANPLSNPVSYSPLHPAPLIPILPILTPDTASPSSEPSRRCWVYPACSGRWRRGSGSSCPDHAAAPGPTS